MCSAFFLFFFFFKKWFCLQVSREPIKEQLLTICGPHSLHFLKWTVGSLPTPVLMKSDFQLNC